MALDFHAVALTPHVAQLTRLEACTSGRPAVHTL